MARLPSLEDSEALALGGHYWARLAIAIEEQVQDVRRLPELREQAEKQLAYYRRCYHLCAAAGRWWGESGTAGEPGLGSPTESEPEADPSKSGERSD